MSSTSGTCIKSVFCKDDVYLGFVVLFLVNVYILGGVCCMWAEFSRYFLWLFIFSVHCGNGGKTVGFCACVFRATVYI